jgi:hypothetical protein
MPTFTSIQQIGNALDTKIHRSFIYKATVQSAGTATMWIDASMSSGIPKYNAYAGNQLESTQLIGSGNAGIFVGASTDDDRHLVQMNLRASAAVPSFVTLCDYLMFYPLIDFDSTDLQEFSNVATLPRYTDGDGVRAMLVVTVPTSAEVNATVVYTDTDDVQRTVTTRILIATGTGIIGTGQSGVSTSGNNPFIELVGGSKGVKSIQSIQLSGGAGGFGCLVLVKPIASLNIFEANTVSEINFINDKFSMPHIYDGAYLNFIMKQGAAATAQYTGELQFVLNN